MINSNLNSTHVEEPLIYLGSPYTYKFKDFAIEHGLDPDKSKQSDYYKEYMKAKQEVEHMRYRLVSAAAGYLVAAGNIVFCPIAMTHSMAIEGGIDPGFAPWQKLDEFYLERSDIFAILTISGWESSDGLAHERQYMDSIGKPTIYIPGEFAGFILQREDIIDVSKQV